MKAIKFLHFSDVHLDVPFTSMKTGKSKISERRRDIIEVFDSIINLAKKECVDTIFISGDLYEHSYVKKSTIEYINKNFSEIAEIKIFIIPGNHDPYVNNSYYKNYDWAKNVFILSEEKPFYLDKNIGLCVYGIGFENFFKEKNSVNDIKCIDKRLINVLLIHGTVDINIKGNVYNPVKSQELAQLGMDYIALGHFHKRIEDVGGKGVIYNAGSPEPLGFDEEGEHGVFIGSINKLCEDEKNLTVNFICLNKRQYKSISIKFDKVTNIDTIIDKIHEETKGLEGEKNLLHVTLKGYTDRGFKINVSELKEILESKFFYIKIKNDTIPFYDFDEIMEDAGIKGLFVKKMMFKIEYAKSEREKELLLKSLCYGLEALEGGHIEVF
ncbi:UNVERIFIED_CONTAM: DNA repair exonuclease SbcCD nuclease subunit [Acetivibrio alkalicellulosi]